MRSNQSGTTASWLVLACLLVTSPVFGQSVRYVDDDAPAGGDAVSWATAYKYLQDALSAAAGSGGTVSEIRVAKGTYKPDQGAGRTPGDRNATFQLLNNLALKGGYAGLGAPDPDVRDITANATILSGDLAGNDGPDFANNTENSYRVVNGSGTSPTTVLDGLSIAAGNGSDGAGAFVNQGSPHFTDCTFKSNKGSFGGGLAIISGNPSLVRCTFLRNSASQGGGLCSNHAAPTLSGCAFRENYAASGDGVYSSNASIQR